MNTTFIKHFYSMEDLINFLLRADNKTRAFLHDREIKEHILGVNY